MDPTGGGLTGDEFAWSVVERQGDRIVTLLVGARGKRGRHPFDLDAAVAACAADLAAYGLQRVTGDRYSAGWVIEAFQRHGILYSPSGRPKSELYLDLLPLVTMGRLELPPDPELIKQAKLLERRRGAQGKDVVDHPVGAHDDRINSVALAVAGLTALPCWENLLVLAGGQRLAALDPLARVAGQPILTSWEERSIARSAEAARSPGAAQTGGLII